MNFRRCIVFNGGGVRTSIFPIFLLTMLLSAYLAGFVEQVQPPSAEQVAEFQHAHPTRPSVAGVL